MGKHADDLPQLCDRLFLTDGGIETTLVFHDGFDLPHFAAFVLLDDVAGTAALRHYYRRHAMIARDAGLGFVLESPTWRASPDWGAALGYDRHALAGINRRAIALMAELQGELASATTPMVISGCIGPRGDGYDPGRVMTAVEAEAYHGLQARSFAEAGADIVGAITMTNAEEAIGIARAAAGVGLPSAISFTLETDGCLPTGQPLAEAIAMVDAATERAPAYYMINCAHPTHFEHVLMAGGDWRDRLRGLRANASCRSHAELDAAPDLDDGDPEELAAQYVWLRALLPKLNVLGGCCGTDHRHIEHICRACRHDTVRAA